MRKNIYEIFEEFSAEKTKKGKIEILAKNWTPTLKTVLELAYNPNIKWKYKKFPDEYKTPDTVPGVSFSYLEQEIKRLYMFQEGNPTAEKLTDKRRKELLLLMLESLEPKEAKIVIGIFNKDLGVSGLTYKFIHDNIPGVLPD